MSYEPPEVNIHENYEPPRRQAPEPGKADGKLKVITILLVAILVIQAVSLVFTIVRPMAQRTQLSRGGAPFYGQQAPSSGAENGNSGSGATGGNAPAGS